MPAALADKGRARNWQLSGWSGGVDKCVRLAYVAPQPIFS
jgi:hypothetical protein